MPARPARRKAIFPGLHALVVGLFGEFREGKAAVLTDALGRAPPSDDPGAKMSWTSSSEMLVAAMGEAGAGPALRHP